MRILMWQIRACSNRNAARTLPESCQYAARTLPGCCQDAARTLLGCCQLAASMLPACCQDAASLLPGSACPRHDSTPESECSRHVFYARWRMPQACVPRQEASAPGMCATPGSECPRHSISVGMCEEGCVALGRIPRRSRVRDLWGLCGGPTQLL